MATLVAQGGIEVAPVIAATAAHVAEADAASGKGNQPAGLNSGDCFAYALAHRMGYPASLCGPGFLKVGCSTSPLSRRNMTRTKNLI